MSERAMKLAQIDGLVSDGMPVRRACLECGLLFVNYYRWKAQAKAVAVGWTIPREIVKRGRKAKFELLTEESRRLRFWALVKGSVPLAVEAAIAEATSGDDGAYFEALRGSHGDAGEKTVKLRPELARALMQHWQGYAQARRVVQWPLSIQRACRVTEDEKAAFRGRKALDSRSAPERRGAFIIDEDGARLPWFPNAIFCSDDMSLNDPFKFMDAATGAEMTGRQALFTTAAYSLKFLGCSHIGRDRDSYRAEDIAGHVREVVEAHGLPLVWRFERGRWDNNFINGCPIPGVTDDQGEPVRWGGLDAIMHVAVKFSSRGKEIEGCFNLLQSLMDHGGDGRALSIGRNRGEFEKATRLMLRADRDADAMSKFWSITESADHVARAMRLFETRPKERETFGCKTFTPEELHATAVKRVCPQNEEWRLCAIKTAATIRRGMVEVKVPHYPLSFRFRVHGAGRISGAHFADAHEIMMAFDPSEAWKGAVLFNRDKSARNRDGWGWLERIGVADHMPDVPQEDMRAEGYSTGQKRASAQVRKETRLMLDGTAFSGRRTSHAQDSFGNAVTVKTGSESAGASRGRRVTSRGDELTAPARQAVVSEGRVMSARVLSTAAEDFNEEEELAAMRAR